MYRGEQVFHNSMIKLQSFSGPTALSYNLHKYVLAFLSHFDEAGRVKGKCSPRWDMILANSFALESRPLLRRMLCTYFAKIIFPSPRHSQEKIFSGSSLWEPGVPGGKTHKSAGTTLSFQQVVKIIIYVFLPVYGSSRSWLTLRSHYLSRLRSGSLP